MMMESCYPLRWWVVASLTTLGACGTDPMEARDALAGLDASALTHNTLELVADPVPLGCQATPTAANPRYGGGAAGTCSFETMAAMTSGLSARPQVVIDAVAGTPLPSGCRFSGEAAVGEWEEVPAGCPFAYDAVIGTVDGEHQIIEYRVSVTADAGCWPESCEEVLRLDYQRSPIVPAR